MCLHWSSGWTLKSRLFSFPDPIDSSNVTIKDWQNLGYIIHENYYHYDGFVVLHGTDTMSFTASAIEFYRFRGLKQTNCVSLERSFRFLLIRSDAQS